MQHTSVQHPPALEQNYGQSVAIIWNRSQTQLKPAASGVVCSPCRMRIPVAWTNVGISSPWNSNSLLKNSGLERLEFRA
jgi:hypothetical protein